MKKFHGHVVLIPKPFNPAWQPAAIGIAGARGDLRWSPPYPTADAHTGAVGAQAEAQYQQAAPRAKDLLISAARQDDRSVEAGVGQRYRLHSHAARISVSGCDHRLRRACPSGLLTILMAEVLHRGAPQSARSVRQARDLQFPRSAWMAAVVATTTSLWSACGGR
jgi:hypothetical protein